MHFADLRRKIATTGAGVAAALMLVSASAPALLSAPIASAAQSDYYLKIDTIEGETDNKEHPGALQIESWSWGVSNPTSVGSGASGGKAGSGKASFSDLSFTKLVDKASPILALACASGKHFPSAKLFVRRASAAGDGTTEDGYMITLTDVMCTSLQQTGSGEELPQESISLNFTKIQWEYKPSSLDGAKGGTPASWGYDVKANKKI